VTRAWQLCREEIRCEFLQQRRAPVQFVSVPFGAISAYLVLALLLDVGAQALVFFGVLGTINLGLTHVGQAATHERSQGWLRLKRASPMPPLAHFVAKVVVTLLLAAIFALALLIIAAVAGHAQLTRGEMAVIFTLITLGVLPFCALGLALAYVGGPSTAQTVLIQVTLALIALAAFSLFDLVSGPLGAALQVINQLSPAYHFAALAFGTTELPGLQSGPSWLHAAALALFTALFLALAVSLYRLDEGKTYG